jgi:hypothetical protein
MEACTASLDRQSVEAIAECCASLTATCKVEAIPMVGRDDQDTENLTSDAGENAKYPLVATRVSIACNANNDSGKAEQVQRALLKYGSDVYGGLIAMYMPSGRSHISATASF